MFFFLWPKVAKKEPKFWQCWFGWCRFKPCVKAMCRLKYSCHFRTIILINSKNYCNQPIIYNQLFNLKTLKYENNNEYDMLIYTTLQISGKISEKCDFWYLCCCLFQYKSEAIIISSILRSETWRLLECFITSSEILVCIDP